jgi:hypothetical protein
VTSALSREEKAWKNSATYVITANISISFVPCPTARATDCSPDRSSGIFSPQRSDTSKSCCYPENFSISCYLHDLLPEPTGIPRCVAAISNAVCVFPAASDYPENTKKSQFASISCRRRDSCLPFPVYPSRSDLADADESTHTCASHRNSQHLAQIAMINYAYRARPVLKLLLKSFITTSGSYGLPAVFR